MKIMSKMITSTIVANPKIVREDFGEMEIIVS